ncbi:MAG: aldo/keto reductase [Bacillota bacterium]
MRILFLAAAALGLLGCGRLLGLDNDGDEAEQREPEEQPADISEEADGTTGKSAAEPAKSDAKDQETVEQTGDGLVPTRELGRTGARVSIIGLGGSFLVSEANKAEEAVALIERAVKAGINYIDTAPTYNSSEANIGKAMPRLRKKVFLAGKTKDRTYDGTMRLFERSLERLQTDHLDLLQLHGFHQWRDYEKAFSRDGAYRALEKLKAEGAVRFTGITSHKNPQVVKQAINDHDFDCLLFALNPADLHNQEQSFQDKVLPLARAKEMGTIAMKVASYGRIFRSGGIENMQQALGYVLSFPVSTAIIGISNNSELEENTKIAREFKPLADSELNKLEELVKPYQDEALFFKTAW